MNCETFTCTKLSPRKKRQAVWLINGKPHCNICFLNWLDKHEIGKEKIVRIFEDEALYDDCRRRKRTPQSQASAGTTLTA